MQRSVPGQLLGTTHQYHQQERFKYLTLINGSQPSLAIRSGIKNYDRVISLNGVNIEEYTYQQYTARFDVDHHLPVQLLVCSPATYAHYKLNNLSMHIDVPNIQCLQPVKGIARKIDQVFS